MELTYLKAKNLYKKETYVDLNAGELEVFTPVLEDGSVDSMRTTFYTGMTQLGTSNGGTIPVKFKISKALSLELAISEWGPTLEATIRELEAEGRRQAIMNPGGVNGRRPG